MEVLWTSPMMRTNRHHSLFLWVMILHQVSSTGEVTVLPDGPKQGMFQVGMTIPGYTRRKVCLALQLFSRLISLMVVFRQSLHHGRRTLARLQLEIVWNSRLFSAVVIIPPSLFLRNLCTPMIVRSMFLVS